MDEDDERESAGLHAVVGLGRTLALSDGIFAISMTLVAFQIQIPDLRGNQVHHLGHALRHLGPSYYVFGLTFFVGGAFWMAHHRLFRQLARADERLMSLNLVFLAAIAFLPFPTGVLGRYGGERAAIILYAGVMVAAGVLLGLLTLVAHHRRLLAPTMTPAGVRLALLRSGTMVAVFAASIPLALAIPKAAPDFWILLFPLRLFARPRRSHPSKRGT